MEYLSILRGIINLESNDEISTYLKALKEHRSFQGNGGSSSKNIDEVAQLITSLLMRLESRLTGLLLLKSFLQQCPIEVVEQKGGIWITQILKACNHQIHGILAYEVLAIVVEKSQSMPSFSTNYLPKIYETIVGASGEGVLPALRCAEICLRLYAGPSAPSRGLIEKFVCGIIDTTNEDLSYAVAKCQLLLQQVRGGSVHGLSQKALWENLQLKLIGSLHGVLDLAFEKCTELYDATSTLQTAKLDIPALELSNEPIMRAAQLYNRFRNLTAYLVIALCDEFPVEKSIKPKRILDVIARGLAVTSPILQRTSISDNIAIAALLPQFHLHLLQVLHALMLTLGSHLKMYHVAVLNLLTETLKITSSKNSNGITKPLIDLRSKAYTLIKLWNVNMGNGSRVGTNMEFLIEQISYDIQPFQTEFTLQVLSGTRKHMSKKARRQLHKLQNEQSNLTQTFSNTNMRKEHLSDEGNQTLCVDALSCLSAILQSSSYCMKPTTMKALHIKLLEISSTFYELPIKRQHLYADWRTREAMYNVFFKLIEVPHHFCPPPTQLIYYVLQNALVRDSSIVVRQQLGSILQSIEKIVHPCKEGLLFPINLRQIRNELTEIAPEVVFIQNAGGDKNALDSNTDDDEDDIEDDDNNNDQNDGDNEEQAPIEKSKNIELNALDTDDEDNSYVIGLNKSTQKGEMSDNIGEQLSTKSQNSSGNTANTSERVTSEESEEEEILEPPNLSISSSPVVSPLPSGKRSNETDLSEGTSDAPTKIAKLATNLNEEEKSIDAKKVEKNSNEIDDDMLLADIEASFVDELN